MRVNMVKTKISANVFPVYKTRSKVTHELGFEMIRFGQSNERAGYKTDEAHRHEFYEFFLFTHDGEGYHEIDTIRYPIRKFSVHIVAPGQVHCLNCRNVRGYVLCFSEDFLLSADHSHPSDNYPFLYTEAHSVVDVEKTGIDELMDIIEPFYKLFQNGGKSDVQIMKHYLHIVMLKFKSIYRIKSSTGSNEPFFDNRVSRFKTLIEQYYLTHKPVSFYAEKLSVSANYLNALCKKHEGVNAIKLIHRRILLESKRLLVRKELSIKEVVFMLNFQETAYFIRFFRRQTGVTPSVYRAELN